MSTRRWSITKGTTVGFGLAFVLLLAAGLGGLHEQAQALASNGRLQRTVEILEQTDSMLAHLIDVEAHQIGCPGPDDREELAAHEAVNRAVDVDLDHLRALTDNDPALRDRVAALASLTAAKRDELGRATERRGQGGPTSAPGLVGLSSAPSTMDRIRAAVAELKTSERAALHQRRASRAAQAARVRTWMIASTLLAAALACATLLGLDRQARRRAAAERAVHEEHERMARAEVARAEAEAGNRAKDEFLAVLSHELRSPLQAMLGWVSILKKGLVTGRNVDRAIEAVERNIRLQTQLVDDLLDVSRIIADKLVLDEQAVDVAMIVQTAVESAGPVAEAKGLTLSSSIAEVPSLLIADEKRLRQVVGNLLTNAVKFTPSGGRVSVTLACEGGEVILRVADTGIGITPGFLPHVFDRFRQADASATRAHGGLGLGLSIVKTLAELHGGRAQVESEGFGRGATFTLHLPLRGAPLPLLAARCEPDEARGELDGMTVMLVEDDADGREALRLALEESGARVHPCGSAAEARRMMERAAPDVIVSDIGMPEENGHDFLRSVRARESVYVPAIAITGFASKQDGEEAARSGFDDYLAKPVSSDVLLRTLRDLVCRSGARRRRAPVSAQDDLGVAVKT